MLIEGKQIRNLYICNTTYQLLFCINIVMKRNTHDLNDIILTDRTDFSGTAENLRKENIFDRVSEIHPKEFYKEKGTFKLRWMAFQDAVIPERVFKDRYKVVLENYEAFYACNMIDPVIMQAYSVLKKNNSSLIVYEIEDNYGTYVRPLRHTDTEKSRTNLLYKIVGTPYLTDKKICKSLLYFPDLYAHPDDVPKEKLPLMDLGQPEIKEMLRRIFGCSDYHIKTKYILLEESFKAEGEVNNAEELFTYIVDLVGRENVMLKTHPRNGNNSYRQRDIEVFDAPVAWEALIATENLDDKVLITCTSGTAINTKLLYHSKCKIIFLYELLEGDRSSVFCSPVAYQYLEKFRNKYIKEVFVPNTKEELKEILLKL